MRLIRILTIAAFALTSAAAVAADRPRLEQNKATVIAFYEAVIKKKDFEEASKYLGPRYTQHNPNVKDGPEGFFREKFPNNHSEIKKVFADGDYAILHVHAVREPGTRGSAIVDIFKLENGKIV